ncbi:hypothetical protein BSKO_11453 [Bryopsis sp. KO-2023]|nr:hypothetical protein BSKO_11453 [Bryopsis sp. KO-2023]
MSVSGLEAFDGAGDSLGVLVWRIENFKPVKQDTIGVFSEGDSYIVLNTFERSNQKKYNLHFWLGKDTSKDESGTAAVLSSLLDEKLGGMAVQYRELQGKETDLFLQVFPRGVQYQHGGVDSGFTHVEEEKYETKLLHIRGKRNVRVAEVPLSADSLNSDDCFVLDDGLVLYQWNGKSANRAEKSKALDVTLGIKETRSGKPVILVVEQDDGSEEEKAFFNELGVSDPSSVTIAENPKTTAEALFAPPTLFKAADGGFEEVAKDTLQKSMLTSDGVFVLKTSTKVVVWLGKDVSADKKKEGFATGASFVDSKGLGDITVEVVKEKLEDPLFKQNFKRWDVEEFRSTIETAKKATAEDKKTEVDVAAMVAGKTGQVAKEMVVDDGSGSVTVWRVEDFKLKQLPEDKYGMFLAGDSYVIRYSYKKGGSEKHIIYFWQGRDSSPDEKGTAAALAATMDEELGGLPVQVRVVQNKEPNHFFRMFEGGMVVSLGGLKNADEGKTGPKGEKLYHVKSTDPHDTHAVQVKTAAQSLNSGDSFVLIDEKLATVWHGKLSSPEERSFAEKIAPRIAGSKPVKVVKEGEESQVFWGKLGGKKNYPRMGLLPPPEMPPRLFQISDATTGGEGVVVEEIFTFDQEDLNDDDVMLLDTFREIYLWIGRNARDEEKSNAIALAKKYLEQGNKVNGRDPNAAITEIKSGMEPPMFTCHFLGWDDTRNADFVDPYLEKLKKLKEEQGDTSHLLKLAEERKKNFVDPLAEKAAAAAAAEPAPPPAKPESDEPKGPATPPPDRELKFVPLKDFIAYEELKELRSEDGIDPARKEQYLSDEDFATIFKISRDEFSSMPAWKQTRAKKDAGLF